MSGPIHFDEDDPVLVEAPLVEGEGVDQTEAVEGDGRVRTTGSAAVATAAELASTAVAGVAETARSHLQDYGLLPPATAAQFFARVKELQLHLGSGPPSLESGLGLPATPLTPQGLEVEAETECDLNAVSSHWGTDATSLAGKGRWEQTEYDAYGAMLYEVKAQCGDNIRFFSAADDVEMAAVVMGIATEWDMLEETSLKVALAASRHDSDPSSPGNGYRSLMKICLISVRKVLAKLRHCSDNREKMFFRSDNPRLYLHDYAAVLSTLRKLLQYAVVTDSLARRDELFLPKSEAAIEQDAISSISEIDCSAFYGQRVAFYHTFRVRNVFRVILSAMAAYGEGFHQLNLPDSPNPEVAENLTAPLHEPIANTATAVMHGVNYLLSPTVRAEKVVARFRQCDIPFAKGFWGLLDNAPLAQHTGSLVGPWVAVNKEVPVPITLEYLITCYNDGPLAPLLARSVTCSLEEMKGVEEEYGAEVASGNVCEVEKTQFERLFKLKRQMSKGDGGEEEEEEGGESPEPMINVLTRFANKLFRQKHEHPLGHITTQLISHVDPQPLQRRGGLLLHIHGGGFVAQSPKSHEVYLRNWAKELRLPILSIDYSLAPEAWFPRAVDECFHVYMWALQHRAELGAGRSGGIVIAGDSAGGNLAVAVALKAVMSGVRIPDGVVCAYPVFNVKLAASPSRLLALTDVLLPLGLLECCLDAYRGPRSESIDNPLMSPLYATDEQLRGLPPIRIAASELDPLVDDSVGLVRRLKRLSHDVEMQVVPDMPHGFLSLAYVGGGQGCLDASGIVVNYIKELLNPGRTFQDDTAEVTKVFVDVGVLDDHFPKAEGEEEEEEKGSDGVGQSEK